VTDLFNYSELVVSDSLYRTPGGFLLGKVVHTSGELPEPDPWYKVLYLMRPSVGGLAIMRLEDADGKPLLTLRGSQGMCDIRDLNGQTIGHLGLMSGSVGEVMRSRFLSGLMAQYRIWTVRDKLGNVYFRIVHGEGVRTIISADGSELAVWKEDRLTITHQLPSPLRELVVAVPAAARLVPNLAP
jgi:hypothetical protein